MTVSFLMGDHHHAGVLLQEKLLENIVQIYLSTYFRTPLNCQKELTIYNQSLHLASCRTAVSWSGTIV